MPLKNGLTLLSIKHRTLDNLEIELEDPTTVFDII